MSQEAAELYKEFLSEDPANADLAIEHYIEWLADKVEEKPMIIVLGEGKINLFAAGWKDKGCDRELAFFNGAPGRIGEPVFACAGKNTEELDCFLRIQFLNVESLDVMADMLQRIRRSMEAKRLMDDQYDPSYEGLIPDDKLDEVEG